ncbi:MAG TPA: DUF882 domain-containing protein [Candidatus Krumholzibacteria bacterium]|nr:DUF882 domain-containing protein [Candidatus Krumholzibacteria bacterium]
MRRRRFLEISALSGAALAWPLPLRAAADTGERSLILRNLHTGERERLVYRPGEVLPPELQAAVNTLLRDHRNGDVHPIDPDLLDLLQTTAAACGAAADFTVLSGYRSPATNEALRRAGRSVAKNSFHLTGRAVDVRLAGVDLERLRRAARALHRGGVGHYPGPGFVHLDTGPFRTW